MRIIEINGALDDDLEELLLVSGRLMTQGQLMRKIILRAVDPIPHPTGPAFEFEDRPDDPMYLSIEIPGADADVDLAQAWSVAQEDMQAASLILERDDSFDGTIRVHRSCIEWLEFFSVRHPNPMCRQRYQLELAERRAGLAALKRKAQERLSFGILAELNSI